MNVEALGLEAGEAISDDVEPFADGVEVIESFLQSEVVQVVGAELVAEETREFLILLQECVFPVRSENVMPVLDLIDLGDAVSGQAPQADLATALEDVVDGEVAFEDEIAAVLDLADGVEPRQAHLATLFL